MIYFAFHKLELPTGCCQHLLSLIQKYYNQHDYAEISYIQLAHLLGQSHSTIKRNIKILIQNELIVTMRGQSSSIKIAINEHKMSTLARKTPPKQKRKVTNKKC